MRLCLDCKIEQTEENSRRHSRRCKLCYNKRSIQWTKDHPDKVKTIRRRAKIKGKYGISEQEYNTILTNQQGTCALCKKVHTRRPLNIDHCHKTGKIRGLLCDKCNLAIGLLNDDAALVYRLVGYLLESTIS